MQNRKIVNKILIIPALSDHIDLIKEAQNANLTIYTCDNNEKNLAHTYSDKQLNISLLELDQILQIAQNEEISAVSTFSNDLGAIVASYISSKLELPGSCHEAVTMMANKERFRSFLTTNNFHTPSYITLSAIDDSKINKIKFPAIIKPVDRAGSKGVYIVNNQYELQSSLSKSLSYSLSNKVIIEDFIHSNHYQIHGDAIVQNGEIIFCCLGDQYFGMDKQKFYPIATNFPTSLEPLIVKQIISEIQRFIQLSNYTQGGLNIELRICNNNEIYFIELGPRLGGNYIPKAIEKSCNINLPKLSLDLALGKTITFDNKIKYNDSITQFILRTNKNGTLDSVDEIFTHKIKIIDCFPYKKKGDLLLINDGVDSIISVYILKISDNEILIDLVKNTSKYFEIHLL